MQNIKKLTFLLLIMTLASNVFSQSAGRDTSLCDLDYYLTAIEQTDSYGEWIQQSGPNVTFIPTIDQGDPNTAGNPNALIHSVNTGTVVLIWRTWIGGVSSDESVTIEFLDTPNITFSSSSYYACDLATNVGVEANANTTETVAWEWINPCDPPTTISNPTIYNPTISSTNYTNCTYKVIAKVGADASGACRDTAYIDVNFNEQPVAYAGLDNTPPCGTQDTLDASSQFGGYWEVISGPSGTNCSVSFTNHITGVADITDTNAVASVTCTGSWTFRWHEVNGDCEATDDVVITYISNPISIAPIPVEYTCLDTTRTIVDTQGHDNDTWLWSVDPTWEHVNDFNIQYKKLDASGNMVTGTQYDPYPIILKDFPDANFGDSARVSIPMIITLIPASGCPGSATSEVVFHQRPKPFLGIDTMICIDTLRFHVLPTIGSTYGSALWYGIDGSYSGGGTYNSAPYQSYNALISANLGDSLNIVFSERNNIITHSSCLVKDSIIVEFLKTPQPNAGDDEYHICGNSIQLDASLDESLNSIGRWLLNPAGFFGFSEGDNDDAAVAEPDAWFYHSTAIDPGVDTVYLSWMEYNAKNAQCQAVDIVPVYFWYKDTAYIKLGGVEDNYIDSVCGRAYGNISGNDHMPTNIYSKGYWTSVDGNTIDWYKDGSPTAYTESQLDSIKVGSIAEDAHVWRNIQWIIENGDINGSAPPVCSDTSHIVRIRFDNPVVSEIQEAYTYPELLINCGDSICLNAGSIYNWTNYQWYPNTGDYSFYKTAYSGDKADTLPNPCIVANSTNYPNTDFPGLDVGTNTHRQVYLKAFNGMCTDVDTINIAWAPIPTGIFHYESPFCVEDSATLFINRDQSTGFDRYITDVEWFFEEDDEPTVVTPFNNTNDTIAVYWGNSIENNDFKHAVAAKTTNVWGCTFKVFPPDTVIEPDPSYIKLLTTEHPTCGEEDGEISFTNYSDPAAPYTVEWSNNPEFSPSMGDNVMQQFDTISVTELFANKYYLLVKYQSDISGNCVDTIAYNLHVDSNTIAKSRYEYLSDTSDLYAPYKLTNSTIENTSLNSNKYTWQIYNGTEEDLSLLVYEGNGIIPDYVFSNMGQYLIKLQAMNDKAPNCPTQPYTSDIFVHYESVIEVPNIFTPNGDGYNDIFIVKAKELETYKCVIYNRWGKKVFETDKIEEHWNGKQMNDGSDSSPGSYYYIITGTGKRKQEFEFKGALQLLRDN